MKIDAGKTEMLIDVNVSLGNWPFQKFSLDSAGELSKHLESEGISLALVSSIENILYPDPDVYNRLLLEKLRPYSTLSPVMVLNPTLSNWKERYEEYISSQGIRAIKIFPNYHGYSLSANSMDGFLNEFKGRNIILILQMRLEDERNHYPPLKVSGVDYREIINLAKRFHEVPIICLCPHLIEAISLVKETTNIYIDISFVETLDTVSSLLKEIPAERVVFGSHTPYLYTRSAVMKIKAEGIAERDRNAIMFGNLSQLLETGC